MKLPWAGRAAITDRDLARSLFDGSSEGVALIDRDGRPLRMNALLEEQLGATGASPVWVNLPNAVRTVLAAACRNGQATGAEAEIGSGGRARIFALSLVPIAGAGGLLRVVDRTHERDLEEQLRQSQRLRAVGELAGGIAHDFNNLLTAILGAADDLRGRATATQDRDDLDQIRASAERGAALVRQLLAFGRQQTLQPRVLDLNEAVANSAKLIGRLAGDGVAVVLALEEPGRLVRIDPVQLDRVLLNLAVNAGHAMPDGGTLTIATGHRLVLRPAQEGGETIAPGRYATIEMRDTGIGMGPDILSRIFEPFFTTRREAGGTGLGLSTVHGIVRQSGGILSVESAVGAGTCFRITLPRHETETPWAPAGRPARAETLGKDGRVVGRKILLVEDEPPVRRLAGRALSRNGWIVVMAGCATEALESLSQEPGLDQFACVVSDVVLPGLDGPELVRRLRQIRPDLPALLISGYAEARARDQLAAEDVRFLAKPFAMAELVDAVSATASGLSPPSQILAPPAIG